MKTIAQQLNVKDFPFEIRDKSGNRIYYENSDGFWCKNEYNESGNEIYYENSGGIIKDNRKRTELTMNEIAEKFGISVKDLKIKKK